jgi:putative tricarboxylic transport membrane protein
MTALTYLFQAFGTIFQPLSLLVMVFGVVFGVILGALPGISATMAVILGMSFTYGMDPVLAITFLCAINCAAITGGSITAILFKIPGTPASAATIFDGGPMVAKGEVGRALSTSLFSSAIGNMIGAVIMYFCTAPLMIAALQFGASEMLAITVLSLSLIAILDEDNMLLAIISGLIGLWLSTVGQDPMTGQARFTFGSSFLLAGVDELPFMIGIFALSEVLEEVFHPDKAAEASPKEAAKITKLISLREMWDMRLLMLRESVLGTIIGILPGAGGTIASFLGYTVESRINKKKELFGTGIPEGVAASEAANNAAAAGMMIPLVSMGIPGGTGAAVMAVALSMQGVQVGPLLLRKQPEYLYSIVAGMLFASVAMVLIAMLIARLFARVFCIPYRFLAAGIFILAMVGCYAKNGRINDVYILLFAGMLGFALKKCHFNITAIVLGMVLGNLCETNLRRMLGLATDGVWPYIMGKPITIGFFAATLAVLTFAIITRVRKARHRANAGADEFPDGGAER